MASPEMVCIDRRISSAVWQTSRVSFISTVYWGSSLSAFGSLTIRGAFMSALLLSFQIVMNDVMSLSFDGSGNGLTSVYFF